MAKKIKNKIKVGIIGVGNCFAGLIQGIEYYKKHRTKKPIGLMHKLVGSYNFDDIEFVSAFDVGENKIGRTLDEAVFASPNLVKWTELPKSNVIVREAPILDGIGIYVQNKIRPLSNPTSFDILKNRIEEEIKRTGTEILVNYLPVGSRKATRFWAAMALKTKCAFVNCIPEFIASDERLAGLFEKAGVPIIGDDIKGQIGATIVHRVLARLCDDRGATIDKTYQLNVGGNSVTGDQKVLLKVNGKICYSPIGEFINSLMETYNVRKRSDGKEIISKEELSEKIKCFTIDDNFKIKETQVDAFIRHKIKQPLFEIELDGGRKIKITKDHNLFVLNENGALEPIPVRDLKERESFIAVPENLFSHQKEKKFIDLEPYFKEKGKFLKVHNHPEIKIPVKFPITDEFLQIAGMWLADGSFDRKKGGSNIEIACGYEQDCVKIIKRFCERSNLTYTIKGEKKVALRINSKTLGRIFKMVFDLKGTAYTKKLPSWIFDLSDRQIAQVLRGYVSGDGGISGKQIRWTSVSEELIRDIQTLFLRIGINTTLFKEKYKDAKPKKSYPSKLGYCWHGLITGYRDFRVFTEKVGFIQEEKNRKLFEILKNNKIESLKEKLIPNLLTLRNKWRIKSTTWWRNPQISAKVVLAQIDKINPDRIFRKNIYNLCTGETKFLKIKKIQEIKDKKEKYVYDLSVNPYQRFICSDILVHNTDFLNMKEQERLKSKKISKTEAVTSQVEKEILAKNVYVGPSDFIPFLGNTKLAFIRLEGRMFADIPYSIELRLEVDDKANSGGIVIDAIRCAKLALDRKIGGYLDVSSYFMKHPLIQKTDSEAKEIVERFISR